MSTGIVFVSTGGNKVLRAIRSLHRMDPNLDLYVQLDTTTNTWKSSNIPVEDIAAQVSKVYCLTSNGFCLNGALNSAVQWMKELGHTHACLLHDDVVFSPLPENRNYLEQSLQQLKFDGSGFSFGHMETHVNVLGGKQAPTEWDALDLESEDLWRALCPNGLPARIASTPHFFIDYEESAGPLGRCTRLGPALQVVSIAAWETVGGFDTEYGVYYDGDFPAACALHNLPPVLCIPNNPMLHLHNQTVGYADPSNGIWGDASAAFVKKYGKSAVEFFRERGYSV